MRRSLLFILSFPVFFCEAQLKAPAERVPVFKQVTHPFMPPITSGYFFFSQDGLMWFSTAQGLTSFDGSDIVYYSSLQESVSLGLNQILSIEEDAKRNFYIGTPTGFYYYDRLTKYFTTLYYTYSDNHKKISPGIFTLYLDKKSGILYGGCGNGGMYIYNPTNNNLSHYNLDASKADSWQDRKLNTVVSFVAHATDSNKLWVGTYHGIYLFDKKEKTFYQDFEIISNITHKYNPNFSADNKLIDVSHMDVANDSIIWFNSWAGGFAKYNSRTGKATIVFGRDALYKAKDLYYGYVIRKFVKLSDDKYLLGINNGKTAIFDTRTQEAVYFNVSGINYPEEETKYVANDRHGNTWLLQRGFLYVSIPEKLRLQQVPVPNLTAFSFSTPKIRGIYFDSSSHLYYGTFLSSTGVHVYDTNFIQQTVLPTSIINNFYNYGSTIDVKITKDGSGRLWTTGWENHVMLPGTKKFELIGNQFPSLAWLGEKDRFVDMTTTRNGNILVKRNDGTVFYINHTTLAVDTIHCPVIKETEVEISNSSAWYDSNRDMVYLTGNGWISQYDLHEQVMRVISHQSLFGSFKSQQGVCIPALDAEGRIWFMIPGYGIRIIDPTSLNCIDSIPYGTKGLLSGDYTAMIGGSDHYILLRSLNGIAVYDYRKRQSFLFDHSNGLSSPDNKAFLYSNGHVIISHSGRFEYFKLSGLNNYSSIVTPYLNTIIADTAAVYTRTVLEKKQNIKLLHNQNTLSFSFSAPEFFFPERIEYAYQFTPVDKDWHYTNYFNRKIIYTKLSPGKYTFRLKAQMQGGNWEMKPVEYFITIVPAWWQTSLFKIICGLIVLGSFFYFNRRRIQNIRNKERQKLQHEKELLELEAKALRAQMNPHFIFNSLNSIKSLINKNENDIAANYLTTFSKLIRTLFQNSDKREVSLYEEMETCKLYTQLEQMRFGDKVKFVFDIDENIDLKDIKVPALILQPFIENAIWHGLVPKESGGKVIVSVSESNGKVECVIDDDGIGRDLSNQYKTMYENTHESKGIGLTQSRLNLDKLLNEREDSVQIIDKINEAGKPIGTKAIIIFKENRS